MASRANDPRRTPGGVVAVGASAGGVEALTRFAGGLPAAFRYPILIAMHMPPNAPSVLARILDRSGPLPAVSATDGAAVEPSRIYVAVPNRHLLVHDHRLVLSEGPTENRHRPAINALFRSAAVAFGQRAVAVLMSGVLDDGVLGAEAIRSRGGTTVVQSADDALFPAMPLNALRAGVVDHQVSAADAGTLLAKLADRDIEEHEMDSDLNMELENRIAMTDRFSTAFDSESLGPPSGYVCPDCSGSLMTVNEGSYRCRVGHAWTGDSLIAAREGEVSTALWVALRSLQEKANLARRMALHAGPGARAQRYTAVAEEAEHAVSILGERLPEVTSDVGQRAR
jgi:two-component system, chemotaxis family, protein-glutamate methylesterase/glutaminase